MPAEQQSTKPRKTRTVLKVIVATQIVLALLTATLVTFAYHRIDGKIEAGEPMDHQVEKEVQGPREPLNILFIGSDTRDGADNGIDSEGGGGGSDLTILLHVSADRKQAYGVSLPRDAMVARPDCEVDGRQVPGADPAQFNTAYAVGGAPCTAKTVESLTGIYVDHFVALEFGGFVDMVDAVGGVTVCIPTEVDDPEHDIHLPAGTHELDGAMSLQYMRERYQLSVTGDIGRMKRQQAFIASLINKVMSAGTLTQPTRVYDFLAAVTESIKVDEGLDSVRELTDLAMQFQDTGLARIKFITVPFEEYAADRNRLQFAPAAKRLWKRIRSDEPLGREFSEGSISAAEPPNASTGATGTPSTGSPLTESPSTATPDGSDAEDEEWRAEARASGLCA